MMGLLNRNAITRTQLRLFLQLLKCLSCGVAAPGGHSITVAGLQLNNAAFYLRTSDLGHFNQAK
jgi:hypothetical protein